MRKIALIASLILGGCSHFQNVLPKVNPPANSLTLCQILTSPGIGESEADYLEYVLDVYYECALGHDALVKWSNRS